MIGGAGRGAEGLLAHGLTGSEGTHGVGTLIIRLSQMLRPRHREVRVLVVGFGGSSTGPKLLLSSGVRGVGLDEEWSARLCSSSPAAPVAPE